MIFFLFAWNKDSLRDQNCLTSEVNCITWTFPTWLKQTSKRGYVVMWSTCNFSICNHLSFFLRTSVTCGRTACNSFTALCNSLLSLVTGSFCMTHTSISVTSGLIAYKSSQYAAWSLILAGYFLCPFFVGALIFSLCTGLSLDVLVMVM